MRPPKNLGVFSFENVKFKSKKGKESTPKKEGETTRPVKRKRRKK